MKKSEMKFSGVKTAGLQRLFRKWHANCVLRNDSELRVFFGKVDNRRNPEHMATCSKCLVDDSVDYGFGLYSPFVKEEIE